MRESRCLPRACGAAGGERERSLPAPGGADCLREAADRAPGVCGPPWTSGPPAESGTVSVWAPDSAALPAG
eukprot:2854850-Lingulodinium_polyedra.AAC.1